MRQIWIITKRELQSFFDSLTAYIMLIAFLGFSGLFTWLYGSDIFFLLSRQACRPSLAFLTGHCSFFYPGAHHASVC